MRRLKKVEVGQRFQSIGAVTGTPAMIYEVHALFRSRIDGLDYARIATPEDPSALKSIAVATLLNPRQFAPVEGARPPGSAERVSAPPPQGAKAA